MNAQNAVAGIEVTGPVSAEFSRILTPEALAFVGGLARQFDTRRKELLDRRQQVQADIDAGKLPDFLPETRPIREGDWKIEPVPDDLKDRRIEITGPVDRKMVINALNSGASTYMADFEDSHCPNLGRHHPGADQPQGRGRRIHRIPESGRKILPPGRSHRHPHRASPGLASGGKTRPRRRPAGFRQSLRFRPLLLP